MRSTFGIIVTLAAALLVGFLAMAGHGAATYSTLADHAAGCVIALVLGCVGCWLLWDED